MADYTRYKKLELPKTVEKYDVGVANKNNLIIDSELNKLDLKNQSQDKLFATKEALDSEITRATASENNIIQDLTVEISRAKSSESELSNHIQEEIHRALQSEGDIREELNNYLPLIGGTLTDDKIEILRLKNSSQDANAVSMRFKIPANENEKEVMLTAFSNGQFEIWDDLNGISLFKSSINGIFYKNKNLLVEGTGDSTSNKGVIELLTDINQINGTHRFWDIHNIDADYAKEIGLETIPGDYHLIISYYNGDGTEYKYGNLFISTPRWNTEFYYLTINKDKVNNGGKKVVATKHDSLHIHNNKNILDNLDESVNGTLLYNGQELGSNNSNNSNSNEIFIGANQSGFYPMRFYFSNLLSDFKEEIPDRKKCVFSAIMKIQISVLDTLELENENGTFGSTATNICVDSYLYLCNSETEVYKNPSGYDRVRFRVALKAIGGEFNSQYGKITSFSNAKNDNAGFTHEDFGLVITPAAGYHFNVNIIPLNPAY